MTDSQHSPVNHQLFLRPSCGMLRIRTVRGSRFPSFCNTNIFRLSKKTQRFLATFAAHAALFHPAKRDAEIAHEPAIYPNGPGVNSLCNPMCAAEVLRPDAR